MRSPVQLLLFPALLLCAPAFAQSTAQDVVGAQTTTENRTRIEIGYYDRADPLAARRFAQDVVDYEVKVAATLRNPATDPAQRSQICANINSMREPASIKSHTVSPDEQEALDSAAGNDALYRKRVTALLTGRAEMRIVIVQWELAHPVVGCKLWALH